MPVTTTTHTNAEWVVVNAAGSARTLSFTCETPMGSPARYSAGATPPAGPEDGHLFPDFRMTGPISAEMLSTENLYVRAMDGARTKVTEG